MFEQHSRNRSTGFWKFFPVALLIFVATVSVILYMDQSAPAEPEELTGILRDGDPDYQWYEKYVEIREPRIQMGKNVAGNRIVILSGVIENQGEKALDVVEVKVVFFNYDTPVWESVRIPLRPGPYTPAIQPLTERAFTFYVEKIPEGWNADNAEVSLHGFRFAEEADRAS